MRLGLQMYSEGAEDDPFVVLTSALDRPFLPGPINKDRREDFQLWSALQALAFCGVASHPLGAELGEDPPDRYLIHGDRAWGMELTELTVQDIRADLAPVRRLGRKLQERLRVHTADFTHLRGKIVSLSKLPTATMPKDHGKLCGTLEEALREDKGFLGEDADFTHGMPTKLGARGIYGEHGPFSVIVNPGGDANAITVSAFSQSQVRRSEAIAALASRVKAKDKKGNELLLITCGLLDGNGYTCPADDMMFQLLREAREAGTSILPEKPFHIRGLLIHQWNSPNLLHWEAGGDLPWRASKRS